MASTTNYGWTTPNDTDLVKDGAAAIRTLGSSIDTTTKALNPSTTLGDVEYRSATANTNTRLPIGTTGQVLTVTGGVPTWATAGGGTSWSLVNAGGTSLSGNSTTVSGITGADKLMVILRAATSDTAGRDVYLRFNGDTGAKYNSFGFQAEYGPTYSAANFVSRSEFADDNVRIASFSSNTASIMSGTLLLTGGNTTNDMMYQSFFGASASGGSAQYHKSLGGFYDASATISSISFTLQSGNFTAGTIYVYKSA